jgi:hypothetical protein
MDLEDETVIDWYDNLIAAFAPVPSLPDSPTSVMAHAGCAALPAPAPAPTTPGKRYLNMEHRCILMLVEALTFLQTYGLNANDSS